METISYLRRLERIDGSRSDLKAGLVFEPVDIGTPSGPVRLEALLTRGDGAYRAEPDTLVIDLYYGRTYVQAARFSGRLDGCLVQDEGRVSYRVLESVLDRIDESLHF